MESVKKISGQLLDEWSRYFPQPAPAFLDALIVHRRPRYIVYLFEPHARRPCAFAKVTGSRFAFDAYRHEYGILERLREVVGPSLCRTMPVPLFLFEGDSELALVEKMLPGRLLTSSGYGRQVRHSGGCRLVVDWWRRFARALVQDKSLCGKDCAIYLDNIVKRYERVYGHDPGTRERVRCFEDLIDQGCWERITTMPVHGDFWRSNILRDKGDVFVVDWERSSLRGLPLFDLFLFCVTLFRDAPGRDDFLAACLGDVRGAAFLRDIFSRAAAWLDIPGRTSGILFQFFLMEMTTQGLRFYDRPEFGPDKEWKRRFDVCFVHREQIQQLIFGNDRQGEDRGAQDDDFS